MILRVLLMVFSVYMFYHLEIAHQASVEFFKFVKIETQSDQSLFCILVFLSGFTMFLLGNVLLFPEETYKLIGKIKKLK